MEAKTIAKNLYYKYYNITSILGLNNWFSISRNKSKQCALITVNEILDTLDKTERIQQYPIGIYKAQDFWNEVKKEIDLL